MLVTSFIFNCVKTKNKVSGLERQPNIRAFSAQAGSLYAPETDINELYVRQATMRNLRELTFTKSAFVGGVNRRARNVISYIAKLTSTVDISLRAEKMRAVTHNNLGWAWERVVSVPHGGTLANMRLVRRAQLGGFDNTRTPYAIRSLVGRGLHNVTEPTRLGLEPLRLEFLRVGKDLHYRTTFYKLLRLRFERWFFKCLGGRTYIWFSNIWRDVTSRINKNTLNSMYAACMQKLAKRGSRFFMEPQQAHIVFQSIFLAVTSITGLQFFMKMMSTMISMFRSHWQLVRYLMGLFFRCKNYFWFKSLYNYRLVMRGKFGGQLRARQEVFQHGVVKIHQWDQNINYYRIFPVTIYGVFSVRFWLQLRDMRMLRLVDATGDILRYSKHKKPRARRARG